MTCSSEKKFALETFIRAGECTANGRVFSKEVLQKAIEKYQEQIEKGEAVGYVEGFLNVDSEEPSHRIEELKLSKNGTVSVQATILPNEAGAAAARILDRHSAQFSYEGDTTERDGIVEDFEFSSVNLRPFGLSILD